MQPNLPLYFQDIWKERTVIVYTALHLVHSESFHIVIVEGVQWTSLISDNALLTLCTAMDINKILITSIYI
ncbi:hypothetical protein E2320_015927 [Naja naja]|nr:hypothetical protein E2320_015927 [Naja naja]